MPDKSAKREATTRDETRAAKSSGVKRPLVPVVLALMLGLAAAAWGVHIPGAWLVAILAGLLAVMLLLFFRAPVGTDKNSADNGNDKPHDSRSGRDDPR